MPYQISPFEDWVVDLSGSVPKRPCCPYLNQRCNHIVFRSSYPDESALPLAPFALEWELDTESSAFHINPFTGRMFGEAVKGGEYLTTEQFDKDVNQLFFADIVSPDNSITGLHSARKFFEEEEEPLGVIFFHDEQDMRPYLSPDGVRGLHVVFLPSSPIQSERLGVWYGNEREKSYCTVGSPNFLWGPVADWA